MSRQIRSFCEPVAHLTGLLPPEAWWRIAHGFGLSPKCRLYWSRTGAYFPASTIEVEHVGVLVSEHGVQSVRLMVASAC